MPLPVEETIAMLKKLLAGEKVVAVTPAQKKVKKGLTRDIAYAKKKGWQIDIPSL
jgi:hypothetical protein